MPKFYSDSGVFESTVSETLTFPTTRTTTGTTSNLAPTTAEKAAGVMVWNGASNWAISGILWSGVTQGQRLRILNVSTTDKDLTLTKLTGTAGNQYLAKADIKIERGEALHLVYFGTGWTGLGRA